MHIRAWTVCDARDPIHAPQMPMWSTNTQKDSTPRFTRPKDTMLDVITSFIKY